MNDRLLRLSELCINGHILHKLDLIGTITIHDQPYFTVYRRYNNLHEIVVVDYHGDIYLQKDLSLSESLSRILCIPRERVSRAHIHSVISFLHRSELPSGTYGLLERTWTEIQQMGHGIVLSLEGVFDP